MPDGVPCHRVIKLVHAALQTATGGFIVLAVVFAVLYKQAQHNRHFWSAHSWIGAGAIFLYCAQYPLGTPLSSLARLLCSRHLCAAQVRVQAHV